MSTEDAENRPPLASIFLFSTAGLAYEVLLMRLFSIVHWHHFAYMMISVALLGFAASGTFIAIMQTRLLAAYRASYLVNGFAFAVTTVVCFLIAQRIPFNTLEVLWDTAQWAWLPLVYVLLALPFFLLANLIALSLSRYEGRMGRVYGADLVGAGLGAGLLLLMLYLLHPATALKAVASIALVAFSVALFETRVRRAALWLAPAAIAAAVLWSLPAGITALAMTPYKGLPQTLLMPGTKIIGEHSSPMGLVTVVDSPEVPFRHAPGMSLSSSADVPPQLGIFSDGDGFSALTRFRGDVEEIAYLDALTSALPYHLLASPRVLIVGANGDAILQSVGGGASEVDVVEINPDRVALLNDEHAERYGWRYLEETVRLHIVEARAWITASDPYDLVFFPLAESSAAAGTGVHGLMEDFLFTREAFSLYFEHLTDDGMIAISRWVKLPPRDVPKLVNTAIEVLSAADIRYPERHIVLIRGWKTTTLLLSRSPLNPSQTVSLRRFAKSRSFDVVHYPGITDAEINRYNILETPYYADALRDLLGADRERFNDAYPFAIETATDDRPYFFQFFRWASLRSLMQLRGVGGFAYFEWGYPILIMTLVQASVAGAILIIAPFLMHAERRHAVTRAGWWVVAYFGLLGFVFMFVEIAFIQKLTLFLNHPIHAAAAVLAGFLVFAGIGSRTAAALVSKRATHEIIRAAGVLVAGLAAGYILLLPWLFGICLDWPLAAKLCVAFFIVAPLAFAMGMPFPMGLERLSAGHPAAVPWAWCINGCTSVIGAVLGALGAIHLGFTILVLGAAVGYVGVALIGGRQLSGIPR